MKKIISMILALALVMSFGVTAFAAGEGEHSNPVTATYVPFEEDISVDISWGSLAFIYEDGVKDNIEGYWYVANEGDNTITVTNTCEGTFVDVKFKFALVENAEDLGVLNVVGNWTVFGVYDDGAMNEIGSGIEEINVTTIPSNREDGMNGWYNKQQATIDLSGAPTKALDNVKIGEVTITLTERVEG